jgi:excisionase family DNA binding protein
MEPIGTSLALVADETPVSIRTSTGRDISVPEQLGEAIKAVVRSMAEGRSVVVADSEATVSPTTAAQMLGVSRPLVTRWIAEGLLTDSPVGSHHKIPISSILELRTVRAEAGYRAMEILEMAEKDSGIESRANAALERARQRITARSNS